MSPIVPDADISIADVHVVEGGKAQDHRGYDSPYRRRPADEGNLLFAHTTSAAT